MTGMHSCRDLKYQNCIKTSRRRNSRDNRWEDRWAFKEPYAISVTSATLPDLLRFCVISEAQTHQWQYKHTNTHTHTAKRSCLAAHTDTFQVKGASDTVFSLTNVLMMN